MWDKFVQGEKNIWNVTETNINKKINVIDVCGLDFHNYY